MKFTLILLALLVSIQASAAGEQIVLIGTPTFGVLTTNHSSEFSMDARDIYDSKSEAIQDIQDNDCNIRAIQIGGAAFAKALAVEFNGHNVTGVVINRIGVVDANGDILHSKKFGRKTCWVNLVRGRLVSSRR